MSENAEFAEACAAAGLNFVGPAADIIRMMGSKIEAKKQAVAAGVPVVPGYNGADQSDAALCEQAEQAGFPLLIKASAGGGGRGMRVITSANGLSSTLSLARNEAEVGFGDASLLLERYIARARHIEVQILADIHGNILHLYERDCSLQRNHQKVIEEAPAPGLSAHLREKILKSAVKLCKAIGYQNAGTVEFLLDDETGEFFFLEMNIRLQVEHPVTEAITGLDLVEWQLRIAGGEQLAMKQKDITTKGWAIEARVAAENPAENYSPETGEITFFSPPDDCRTDSGVKTGSTVPHHYDSMLAKVIAHGDSRQAAIARLISGISQTRLEGPGTNLGFLSDLLRSEPFVEKRHHTETIAQLYPDGWCPPSPSDFVHAAAIMARFLSEQPAAKSNPWQRLGPWRSISFAGLQGSAVYYLEKQAVQVTAIPCGWEIVFANGACYQFSSVDLKDGYISFEQAGQHHQMGIQVQRSDVSVTCDEGRFFIAVETGEEAFLENGITTSTTANEIRAPIAGLVIDVLHEPGANLCKNEPVVILEAMKMMQTLVAPCDGTLTECPYKPGEIVEKNALLAVFKPEEQ